MHNFNFTKHTRHTWKVSQRKKNAKEGKKTLNSFRSIILTREKLFPVFHHMNIGKREKNTKKSSSTSSGTARRWFYFPSLMKKLWRKLFFPFSQNFISNFLKRMENKKRKMKDMKVRLSVSTFKNFLCLLTNDKV